MPGEGSGPLRVLVARELCLFLHVDASAVPARERAGFVMLAVRRAAPFDDPEADITWCGHHAAVWYWSASRARSLAGPLPARTRIHGEASHRGTMHLDDEKLELLDLSLTGSETPSAGIEARLWRHGHLVASRWWPRVPSTPAWQVFLRGAGMPSTLAMPEPLPTALHEHAMGTSTQLDTWAGQLQAQWPLLATGTGCLIIGAFCWQLAGIARAYSENSKVESRISQLEKRLDSVISARNAADEASATVRSLLKLRPPASQTRLLAEIAKITPSGSWNVMQWQQPGPETLEITLKGSALDAAAVVNAWEQSPLMQDVTPISSNRPDELVLRARLTPAAEPAE